MLINTIIEELEDEIICGDIDNEGMIKIIELCAMYLNLKTIPKYAKAEGITYNCVKKCRNVREILGIKFVIDNE